jgi:putative Mn2+ efflux pump MntP
MEINTVTALLGGLGLGSLLNSLVTHFTTQKSKKEQRRYEEKKASYLGLLTSLHEAAVSPSDKNLKAYALWQAKCQIFGSNEVAKFTQEIIDTNYGPKDLGHVAFEKLFEAIRQDLDKS